MERKNGIGCMNNGEGDEGRKQNGNKCIQSQPRLSGHVGTCAYLDKRFGHVMLKEKFSRVFTIVM